jgi:hypothetical protein
MKSRLIWTAVLVAAIAGFYFTTIRPALRETPVKPDHRRINRDFATTFQPPPIPPPPLPEAKLPSITLPPPAVAKRRDDPAPAPPEVPVQNGATIDFSTGAAHVRMQGKDKEALDRALREMAEATKDTVFPPRK